MLKNCSFILIVFLFFTFNSFAPVRGVLSGVGVPALPLPFITSHEDVNRYCSAALTERFGEIKGISVLNGMHTSGDFSNYVWCQIRDDECQLFYIRGTAAEGVSLTLLQPEGQELYFIEHQPYKSFMQLKAKNPEKADEFVYWEFDSEVWKPLSEDDWLYPLEAYQQKIQSLYPGHACNILRIEKGKVLALLTDPLDVFVERAIVFRRLQTTTCEQIELFRARADSIKASPDGIFVRYQGIDGHPYAKKINLESLILEEALPVHPLGLHWRELEFNEAGNLLFAKHTLPTTLIAQYWTVQNGNWKLLHEGPYPAQLLFINSGTQVYRLSYSDTGLTLEWLNTEYVFEPTNVNSIPIQLVCGGIECSTKNPRKILALQDYSESKLHWHFPKSSVSTLQAEYNHLITALRNQWREQRKHYADRALSVESIHVNEEEHLDKVLFGFPENSLLKGRVDLYSISSQLYQFGDENQFHQPLQMYSVDIEGHQIPYFYAPSVDGLSNGKTIVMMDGGPEGTYTGHYSPFVKAFTQAGWSVIIPQESLRTGHGWKHYSKGIGEMGRKNLHQLLHIFHDAIGKSLIPNPKQVHLYGCSYGGFVAASFALRWDYLHTEAGLPKLFNFQSIVADAACVDGELASWTNKESILGTTDVETFRRSFMPLHLIGPELSAPLILVHGKVDIRCSANDIRAFSSALKSADHAFSMFWHNGGHEIPHERYPEFLLELMEGRSVSAIATEIGITQEI